MIIPNISAKRGPLDHSYLAGFEGQQVSIWAPSFNAAKQQAIEHFKPSKRKRGLILVTQTDKESLYVSK